MLKLSAKSTSQSIGGEVAKLAPAPVDILKRSMGVIGHRNAKIVMVLLGPKFWNIDRLYFSSKKRLLNFIADKNMERIGELVGFRTDKTWLHLVGCREELECGNARELTGEMLAHEPDKRFGKCFRVPDVVFKEARLGLVHAH